MESKQIVYDCETGKTFALTISLNHLIGIDGLVTKMEEDKDTNDKH